MNSLKLQTYIIVLLVILISCKSDKEVKEMIKAEKITLEDFFKNPQKSMFSISPNGEYYSYLAPVNNRMNIHIQNIDTENANQITFETDRDISGYMWANDDRILFLKDTGGDENFKLFGINPDGTNLIGLTDFDGVRTQIIDKLDDDEDEIIVGLNKRTAQVFDPYRLNIKSGELKLLYENPGSISGWITDHDGKLRMASTTDGVNTGILYRETEDDEFKEILNTNFKNTLSPLFFTFDNKDVFALSNLGRDKLSIVIFDPNTGKEKEQLFSNKDYDISGLAYSKKDEKLTTASYTGWKQERHFFDASTKSIYEFLINELPDVEIAITSKNKDENKFIVRTYSDKTRGDYYFLDWDKKFLNHIESLSPWIDETKMANMLPINYTSRDSVNIHGYLTLPLGYNRKNAKNLPLLVNPHGGPWARDSWGFNPEVQFLANRGYAVLQVNFRGSTGYGKEFWEKSFGQWGLSMQDDITDGVQWLIDEGIADKNRIAIYGGSYGGYATLAG
ncbi:MAG: dipeptidyl aminopeptidase/acylaminoacyl peptidase, partial [Flavobacteriales bacterium]